MPYKPEEILELLDHFGIGKALVHSNYAAHRGTVLRGNRMLAEACTKHDRYLPAFSITPPVHDDAASLDEYFAGMRAANSKAVWLAPIPGVTCNWMYGELFSACAEKRVPVFLHRDSGSPDDFHRILSDFPELRLVLAGASYGEDHLLYPLLRKFPNLHVCLGHFYIPAYGPMRFLEHFPAERLLFGSGLPGFSPGGLIAHVMYADISDSDREKILAGNLTRLLAEAEI